LIPINDLSRRFNERSEISRVLDNVIGRGHWVHGDNHDFFERELAEYLNVDHVLGVASGTDALILALRAVGCGPGSKIISVANAGGYTSIAASVLGCEVLYCDVDPTKLLLDPSSLSGMLSPEITAVVVTHLYGNVAPIQEVVSLCKPFGVRIIEDCAQATGAKTSSTSVGTFGDLGTFSFYPTKNLGGIGDGGAVATNDPELADRVRNLRQYGWSKEKYLIETPGGSNSRLDEIQAAVLRLELKKLEVNNQRRCEIVSRYITAVSGSHLSFVTSAEVGNVCHLGVLMLPHQSHRDSFMSFMEQRGVQTAIHYPVLDSEQPGLALRGLKPNIPISTKANSRIVTIPLFPELLNDEVELICEALREYSLSYPETVTESLTLADEVNHG
jgi:dTDP-3-amino-2,3,6-trideoxy-4-keto-D-glucose/dTDP-3-amino-3,4,6-trideoxy-alpha-D-glucose/dTDP-2,6-dideoxy-D-kanosamine transaminase